MQRVGYRAITLAIQFPILDIHILHSHLSALWYPYLLFRVAVLVNLLHLDAPFSNRYKLFKFWMEIRSQVVLGNIEKKQTIYFLLKILRYYGIGVIAVFLNKNTKHPW